MAGKNKDIAILVRHGESLANFRKIVSEDIDGFPLTELGAKQSVRAGRTLIPIAGRVDSFISSPIIRAIQTGSGVMEGMGIRREIIQEPLLIETKFGKYNNSSMKDFPKFHKEEFGIEPFEENGRRILEAIERYRGINLYFSHALPIKALVCNMLHLEEEDAGGIHIENASITIIDVSEKRILSIGSHYLSSNLISFFDS